MTHSTSTTLLGRETTPTESAIGQDRRLALLCGLVLRKPLHNPAAIVAEDGRISSGGFIFQNGKNIPIKKIRIINQEFRKNTLPVSSRIEVTDALDIRHVLEGKARQIVPIPFTDDQGRLSILAQAFGDFKLDGQSGGYGSYETLRRTK